MLVLLFSLYLLVGPLAWIAVAALTAIGRSRMNLLMRHRGALPQPPPTVSIVIPAKDEAAGIADCVRHVLAQDYPNLQVVVINDRSTDATGSILDSLAANEPRLRVIHVTQLPPGWLGKCHALHVGTRDLTSDYLFFVDSDVQLAPDATRRMVALSEDRQYDAMSIMPQLDARSYWERTLLPPMAAAWASAFKIPLTNQRRRRGVAFANGQIFLIARDAYERVGGHSAVRDQIVEDVALARVLKADGAKVRVMLGPHLARTRMHTNLRQMFHGWARIFAGSAGRSLTPVLATLAFFLVCVASLAPGIGMAIATRHVAHGEWWTVAAIAHLVAMLGVVAWTYRSAGQSVLNTLAWPITWPMVVALLSYAARVCVTGRVEWRGNAVGVNDRVGATDSTPSPSGRGPG